MRVRPRIYNPHASGVRGNVIATATLRTTPTTAGTIAMIPAFRRIVGLMIALCMLSACAAAPRAEERTPDIAPATQPLACKTDADCVVKNVGNCCGYYPACVHRDQPVDPDAVRARCAAEGSSSICGFPEIAACACDAGSCKISATGSSGDPRLP